MPKKTAAKKIAPKEGHVLKDNEMFNPITDAPITINGGTYLTLVREKFLIETETGIQLAAPDIIQAEKDRREHAKTDRAAHRHTSTHGTLEERLEQLALEIKDASKAIDLSTLFNNRIAERFGSEIVGMSNTVIAITQKIKAMNIE